MGRQTKPQSGRPGVCQTVLHDAGKRATLPASFLWQPLGNDARSARRERTAVGQVKIREKIKALDFKDVYAKVAQLDAFMTIGNGICIQVAGEISNNQEPLRRFMQTFVLGPRDHDGKAPGTSFYVHNDIFRYQDDIFAEPELMMEPAAGDAPIEVESNYQAEEIVAEEIDETPIVQAPEPVQEIIEEPVVVEEVKEPEPEL